MSGVRPKQLARMGEFHLEEAILDVLLEAEYEKLCLGAAEISRKAGIFRGTSPMNDAVATGMLLKLSGQSKVEKCKQNAGKGKRGGWKLTDTEFQSRRDDFAE